MWQRQKVVVYLLNPTSNHNPGRLLPYPERLYIFWILHQTTTYLLLQLGYGVLYIFWILHQTTTLWHRRYDFFRCISFESYIKPQLISGSVLLLYVVYLLNPTSNHNFFDALDRLKALYIFWILHQTTTIIPDMLNPMRCISFESYIKPQRCTIV